MRFIKVAGHGTLNQVLNLTNSAQAALFVLKQFKSAAPFQIARARSPRSLANLDCGRRAFQLSVH
jgi:hypothetical protein